MNARNPDASCGHDILEGKWIYRIHSIKLIKLIYCVRVVWSTLGWRPVHLVWHYCYGGDLSPYVPPHTELRGTCYKQGVIIEVNVV
jgi:hypothetical protein